MIDEREIVRRAVDRLAPPEPSFERLVLRRDRKHRNKRITAGVVGIAVFVAAAWIVRDAGVLDRNQSRFVPGATTPEATETVPTVTPTESVDFDWASFFAIPPKGAVPSRPGVGQLVAKVDEFRVGWLYVFADGRVISWLQGSPMGYREQRLTPEGVELVRSHEIPAADLFDPFGVPARVWEDRTLRPYVPSRYEVCLSSPGRLEEPEYFTVLPPAARDVLRGAEPAFDVRSLNGCYNMTLNGARALDEILADAGWDHDSNPALVAGQGGVSGWRYEVWSPERSDVSIYGTGPPLLLASFAKILPDGTAPSGHKG